MMGYLPEASFYVQISTPHFSSALTRLSLYFCRIIASCATVGQQIQ